MKAIETRLELANQLETALDADGFKIRGDGLAALKGQSHQFAWQY